jgi:hypothetical protein
VGHGIALLALSLLALSCAGRDKGPTEAWRTGFDDAAGWELSSDAVADVAVGEGHLRVHVLSAGQVAWATSESRWDNVHLSVEATQISGPHDNEYGVLVRMQDDQHFYAFSISGDGYVRAARYDAGDWTVLGSDWTPHDAILLGEATNRLELVAEGAHFDFRVNDQSVLQVEDTAYATGRLGLYAGSFTEGDVVVVFDTLEASPLP